VSCKKASRSSSDCRRKLEHRLIDADGPRTYIVILETGDEVASSLNRFAEETKLAGSSFKAIGALSSAKVGWFNWQTKQYQTAAEFQDQLEVLSAIVSGCQQDELQDLVRVLRRVSGRTRATE
jgi:hypothetical protein